LEVLITASNALVGPIPDEVGLLVSLRILDLQQNQLTGEIPTQLGDLTALEEVGKQSAYWGCPGTLVRYSR
jgi:Leucine-rich repeat (LRR) protein